jgi:para-nitrobenzyl esterase
MALVGHLGNSRRLLGCSLGPCDGTDKAVALRMKSDAEELFFTMTPVSTTRRKLIQGALASAGGVAASRAAAGGSRQPVAKTGAGKLCGARDGATLVFKAICYGEAMRFMPPHKPKPWRGVREALAYGPSSPQTRPSETRTSEDCLFLNVWTPALRDGGKRAVMVYLHGGAYSNGSGSAPITDGAALCRRGNVVVVTLNHRLNAFGYLYLGMLDGRYADSGNAGQLDLVLALEWVKENIAEFGGDPDCVTVFGQSGGGAKIATLMAMPAAKGLFQRAATMSGQQTTASGPLHATQRAEAYLKALGVSPKRLDELAALPAEKLVDALKTVDPIIGAGGLYFGPVLDMRALPRHPFYPDAPEQSAGIPMIIGNTHDETRAFITDPGIYVLGWEELPQRLAANLRVDISPALVIARYKEWFPGISPSELFFRATTASRSWRGAIVEDELRARAGVPAYAYQLDWPCPDEKRRAQHMTDIALVFDNTGKPGAITGDGAGARKMAAVMSETFIAFAKTGKPDNALIPAWVPYSLARRETMIFDLPPRLQDDPRGRERALFESVPYVQQGI